MKCADLDPIRGRPQSGWPQEAREHLRGCEQCAQLQSLLDRAGVVDAPPDLGARIEASLLADLRPVAPIASVTRVIAVLLSGLVAVVAVANWELGVQGWQARSTLQASVNFSLLGLIVILLAGILAHQMMPGSSRGIPSLLYLAGPFVALLAADIALFDYRWSPRFVPVGMRCFEIGITCAAASAPLFWLALRRGFSVHPGVTGATVGLLSGLTGVTVLEVYCPYLDRLHISAWHLGAALTSALVGALLGLLQSRDRRSA
jgi:hypothetical protein